MAAEGNGDKKEYKFEDVFDIVGHIGFGQFMIYFFIVGIETSLAVIVLYFIFEGANPGWTCSNTNLTKFCPSTSSNPSSCTNLTFGSKYNSLVTEWSLICDKKWISKSMISIFFGGQLLGACISSQISDSFGRKNVLLIIWTTTLIIQGCLGFVQQWELYATMRFFVGVGIGGVIPVSCVLPMEYLGPKWRSLVSFRIGWHLGPLLLAFIAYVTRQSWRYLAFTTGFLFLPLVPLLFFFLPESARWLVQKGRFVEAEKCLQHMAKYNGKTIESGQLAFIPSINEKERAKRDKAKLYTYSDLFRTKHMALLTIVVLMFWFTDASLSYGLNGRMAGFTGVVYINLCISGIVQFIIRSTVLFTANRFGRKKSFLMYISFTFVCLFIIMVLDLLGMLKDHGYIVTVFALGGLAFNSGNWSLTHILTTELYPTLIRNLIMGAGNMFARVGAMISPFINMLGNQHKFAPYATWVCFLSVCFILIITVIPETLDKPMPEEIPEWEWCLCCFKKIDTSKSKIAYKKNEEKVEQIV